MATSGNLPSAAFEGGHFERGLSIEDAERFAASFKPSWELDDAPFSAGNGMSASDHEALAPGGVNSDVRRHYDSGRSEAAAPHAPAPRVESHEPDVSVIIDRSITAAEMERAANMNGAFPVASSPPSPVHAVQNAYPAAVPAFEPSFAQPIAPIPTAPILTAPVLTTPGMAAPGFGPSGAHSAKPASKPPVPQPKAAPKYSANDSLEIVVQKSNKPLFLGIGAAVALALAVLGVRAATTSSDPEPSAAANGAATGTHEEARIPPPPATSDLHAATPAATAAKPAAPQATGASAGASVSQSAAAAIAAPIATHASPPAPTHAAATHAPAAAAPHPAAPRAAAPRATAAPKSPPKAATGGIVRDVPF